VSCFVFTRRVLLFRPPSLWVDPVGIRQLAGKQCLEAATELVLSRNSPIASALVHTFTAKGSNNSEYSGTVNRKEAS